MRRNRISYYLLLCGLLISALFSSARAQAFLTGEAVLDDGGLQVSNSIVWGNVTESTLSGESNLTDEDPLFASETTFSLREESPAVGRGDNRAWDALGLPLVDIANMPHASPMNMGAYENGAVYEVSYGAATGGTIFAYLDNVAVASGTLLPHGTELKVVAMPHSGYRMESVMANGAPVLNGGSYILAGDVEFTVLLKETARKNVYATVGKLNVVNSIIYDNVDLFGNYLLNPTNLISNPSFTSTTQFTLQQGSLAVGLGDGSKMPAGITHDVAGVRLPATAVNAGAYQTSKYTISWATPEGGTLDVFFHQVADIVSGESYGRGTVFVRATPAPGYLLTSLKYNDTWINAADAEKKPHSEYLLSGGSFLLLTDVVIEAVFETIDENELKAAVIMKDLADVFVNNIIYDNLHLPSNRVESANITANPAFYNETNYKLRSSSAAINAGSNSEIESYIKDLAGKDRLQDGKVDMGAFEAFSEGYMITYNPEISNGTKVIGRLEVMNADDGDALVSSGATFPAGTNIKVRVTVLDENYEQTGRIRLNSDEYIEGETFVLNKRTTVYASIPSKRYVVKYSASNGNLFVYNGTAILANGVEVNSGTILIIQPIPLTNHQLEFVAVNGAHIQGAELGGGYLVTVNSDVTITANCTPIYEMDEDGNPELIDPDGDPDDPANWVKAPPKGLITWDLLNATLTATAGGEAVSLGDKLEPGTEVTVTVAPTNASHGILLYQLNGTDLDKNQQTFRFTVPEEIDGKVASSFIAVRYGEDGWVPGDPDPEPTETIYVTMTIPDTMPEGITLNPAPGTYQVAVGSSRVLRFTVDEQYEDQYVFLRINGDYVMIKAPQGLLDFAYTLIDIRQALTIEVIISATANPEEGTTGNTTLTPGVRVTGESGKLTVESDRATKVLVYTVDGKQVANATVNGTKEFYLPAGIYIVKTNSTSVKAAVR